MALSGTLNSSGYNGRYIQFTWTATQDVTNNKSTIKWTLKGAGNADVSWYKAGNFKVVIDGSTVYSTAENSRISLYNGTTIASGSKVITHNADGSRKFKVQIEAGIYTYAVNCTGSTEFTLNTIPRASTFAVSNASVNMGTAVTFTISRASSAFTHKLTLTWGGVVSTIATGVGTSQAWTPPLSLANDIPNSTSSGCIITCITYNGSTEIGRKTLSMTLKVPDVRPSIGSIAVSEAVSAVKSKFGVYVRGKSQLRVVVSAAGVYSSSIKLCSVKILGKTYTGTTITSNVLTSSGSVPIEVTVTDSRGRTATSATSVNLVAYSEPVISKFTVRRCTSDGTLSDEGDRVKIDYAFTVSPVNNKNDKSYKIEYKLKGSNTFATLLSGSVYSADTSVVATPVFSTDNAYDFRMTVTDYFSPITQDDDISTAFVLMDFHSSGTGMAIGKVSERANVLEVALNTEFNGTLRAKKGILLEDTRDTDFTPDEYRAMGRGVFYEFKKCSVVALHDTTSSFCTLVTFVQWKDTSGGSVKQMLYDNDRVWYRYGDSTAWEAWKPILYRMPWTALENGISYKIQDGMCTVRGNSNTTLAISKSGVVACTLPAYARPTVEIFGTLTTKANVCGQVSIGTDGKVTLWTFGSDTTYWAFTINYPIG